jgi:hypothetical protein
MVWPGIPHAREMPHAKKGMGKHHATGNARMAAGKSVSVTGSGWETVVGFRTGVPNAGAPSSAAPSIDTLLLDPLLRQATVTVPGGRAISTSLVNVLLTDDGRVFAGSVPLERLQTAAAAR